ncbi:heavy metal translocatin [Mytilinidion resinicola]|uniref:Heavy metal translocatin n=1 Tax=Mytilinidion resinicola TaxID=574789 RepID=A0A6A6YYH8_9PEZI|nr:heavy metal translocatin [Mytilinidion resinicola]KAF2813996.1 heavy metal translocatin [Mytilinidion resinicola]
MRLLNIHRDLQCKLAFSTPTVQEKDLKLQGSTSSCRLSLTGIICAACTSSIQNALSSTPGVTSASVSLALFQAHISYDSGMTNPEALALVVEENGYGAEVMPAARSWREDFERADVARLKEIRSWRNSFFASILFTIPSVLLPYSRTSISSFWMSVAIGSVEAVLATISTFYCARHINLEALSALRARRGDMSVLSSSGITLGFIQSLHVLMSQLFGQSSNHGQISFDAISVLITVVLGGRYLKALVSRRALGFTAQLSSAMPLSATVTSQRDLDGDFRESAEEFPIDFLGSGDWVIVSPGRTIPGDGIIVKGSSNISETCITGEVVPRFKKDGDEVLAGSKCLDSGLIIRITRAGTNTWLEKTLEFVAKADSRKDTFDRPIEAIIQYFVSGVMILALATVIIWKVFTDATWSDCFDRATAMLLAACPCALGLSIPACIMLSTASASRFNILLAGGTSQLEIASKVRTVIFDKTGTLTQGHLTLESVEISPEWNDSERQRAIWWRAVQALEETQSKHPVAQALLSECEQQLSSADLKLHADLDLQALHLNYVPGLGVYGTIGNGGEDDFHMAIGSAHFLESMGVSLSSSALISKASKSSLHTVFISIDSNLCGLVTYSDTTKSDARKTISLLRFQGINIGLMTGDTHASASALARAVGIPDTWVWSAQKPIEKAQVLDSLALDYGPIAMVGDNLNDIPALSSAAFSICVSRDSEVSTTVRGDAQLLPTSDEMGSGGGSGDLTRIPFLLGLAKETFKTVRQNLAWAVGYNIVALLWGSGLLEVVHKGLVLTPAMASLGMGLSSMFVLMNSMRLERWVPKDGEAAIDEKNGVLSTGWNFDVKGA